MTEDEIPLSLILEFSNQYKEKSKQGRSGPPTNMLWQGVVQSITASTGTNTSAGVCTTTINGVDCPGIRYVSGAALSVGSIVWGIQEGNVKIILGVLGQTQVGRIGYNQSAIGSNENYTIGTTLVDVPYLGVACGPVKANSLIRVQFKIWAAGGTQREAYFPLQIADGPAGTRKTVDEVRWVVVADNGPSPQGTMTFKTATDYANLCCFVQAGIIAGTFQIYMSSGDVTKGQHSFVIVENLGWIP